MLGVSRHSPPSAIDSSQALNPGVSASMEAWRGEFNAQMSHLSGLSHLSRTEAGNEFGEECDSPAPASLFSSREGVSCSVDGAPPKTLLNQIEKQTPKIL